MSEEMNPYFVQLVLSLQMGTMQHLGKIVSPMTGKVERDLEMAGHSIEMLEMIHKKTLSNLTDDERKLLEEVLYELRLNFVDEQSRPAEAPEASPEATSEAKSTPSSADNPDKA